MEESVLISTSDGNEYLIGFSSFNKNIISFEGHEFLGDTDIIEIVLKRQKGNGVSNEALFKIIDRIWEVVHDRKSSIFYFYCDDMHDIARRKNNWSPQKYRSELFSSMFNRAMKDRGGKYINMRIEIKTYDRDVYMHLISNNDNIKKMEYLKRSLLDMGK